MIPFSTRVLAGGVFTIALSVPVTGVCAASATSARGTATGLAVSVPHPQTRADLAQSMRGEAFANASYRLYAEQARREGLASVARVFDRAAAVELGEHFTEEAALDGLAGGDEANLRDAISGEDHESRTMYPRFAQQAKSAGDAKAATRFSEIGRDEATHRDAFRTALRVVRTHQGSVPAPPDVKPVMVPAGPSQVRAQQTKDDLDAALHGEALANAKYTVYAKQATTRGDPAVGRLFTGNADVEGKEHFAEQASLAGLVGTTRSNLTTAIAGERYESQTMYPTFAERAKAAGDTEAARVFSHNAEDEAGHARTFQQARNGLH